MRRGLGWALAAMLLLTSGLAAESRPLDEAWREVHYLSFIPALKRFEQSRAAEKPGSPEWVEATLGMALACHNRQPDAAADKQRAGELYGEVIDRTQDAKDDTFALALILRAKLAAFPDYVNDVIDLEAARNDVERVIREASGSQYADVAALYRAQFDIYTMDVQLARRGITELEAWLQKRPGNPLASTHWQLIGSAYQYPLNQDLKAAESLEKALSSGVTNEKIRSLLYWRIAELYRLGKQKAKASEYYRKQIVEIPRSIYGYSSQQRLVEFGETPPPLADPFAKMRASSGAAPAKPAPDISVK